MNARHWLRPHRVRPFKLSIVEKLRDVRVVPEPPERAIVFSLDSGPGSHPARPAEARAPARSTITSAVFAAPRCRHRPHHSGVHAEASLGVSQ